MTKRILCVCNHGNIRSVALKYLLWRQRELYPNEAIAVGMLSTSNTTMEHLIVWADMVIDMHDGQEIKKLKQMCEELDAVYIHNPIGKDIWHNPQHPELQEKLYPLIKELKEIW